MRKYALTAALLFALFGSFLLAQGKKLRVTAESADIHIEPHTSSTVIGTVKKNDLLQLFDAEGGRRSWYYVSFYSQEKWATITGFIQARHVEWVGEEPEKTREPEPEPDRVDRKKPEPKKVPAKRPPVREKAAAQPETPPEAAPVDAPLTAFAGKVRIKAEVGLLRASASPDARVIQEVKSGDLLETIGAKGEWFRIKAPRRDGIVLIGFIHRGQIEIVEGGPPPAGAAPEKPAAETETAAPPLEVEPPAKEQEVEKAEAQAAQILDSAAASGFDMERPGSAVRIGLRLGLAYAGPAESRFGSGLAYGGALSVQFSKYLAVEIGGVRLATQVDGSPDGLSAGDLTILPISLCVQGRYPISDRFVPYALAGAGYTSNSFSLDPALVSDWEALGFTLEESVDNAIGFMVGAGLDYFLRPEIAINLDVRYWMTGADGGWSMADQFTETRMSGDIADINLNALHIGLGIKVFFSLF